MDITEQVIQETTVLDLRGRFDFSARREFESAIRRVQNGPFHRVVLNLKAVTFLDSTALGMLVMAHQALLLRQVCLSMVNPSTLIQQVLDLANVSQMIPIYPQIQEVQTEKNAPVELHHSSSFQPVAQSPI